MFMYMFISRIRSPGRIRCCSDSPDAPLKSRDFPLTITVEIFPTNGQLLGHVSCRELGANLWFNLVLHQPSGWLSGGIAVDLSAVQPPVHTRR